MREGWLAMFSVSLEELYLAAFSSPSFANKITGRAM